MRWFPVTFLANGVFTLTHVIFELTTLCYESHAYALHNGIKNCFAYSISSVAETRDKPLEFFLWKWTLMGCFSIAFLANGVSLRHMEESN